MELRIKSRSFVCSVFILVAGLFFCGGSAVHANIPDIEGYVLVSGTNTPVVGVWVKLTNNASQESNCVSGAKDQSRYAKTDATGKYTFVSWTNGGSSAVGEGVKIDTNLDGSTDAEQYPSVDLCDPTDPTPGSIFSCGRDPFKLEVIKPQSWSGVFDTYGDSNQSPCTFCLNNGTFTYNVPIDLFYHPSGGGGNTPTPTSAGLPTATPALNGTVSLNPIPPLTVGGGPVTFIPSVSGPVSTITYTISNPAIVSVCATSGACPPGQATYLDTPGFGANVQGFTTGSTTITASCTVPSGSCTGDSETITTSGPSAWWQSVGGDIVTTGNILSTIPTSCIAPTCTNSLIIYTGGTSPGIAIAGGSISSGNGSVSQDSPPYGWQANTSYTGAPYTYDYFENKSKCGTMRDLSLSSITSLNDLTSLGASSNGYYWVRYAGATPLTISGDLNIGDNKVVLFVKNQDLLINGNITTTKGKGLFMSVVGASPSGVSRNIIVNPSVSSISGLFYADGQFRTGTSGSNSDTQLSIRGSIVAMAKILLQRSLGNNTTTPAEIFEYAPDQLLLFPSCLGETNVQWKELAP
jgi:hypothetical protein